VNTPQLPSVELIQGSPQPEPTGPARWRRWKVFFSVLLLSSAVGLAIVYGRDPIYRAAASILTVKPKAVDRRSEEADIEHVAIQGRLLLGEELLGRLAQRLAEEGDDKIAGLDQLRSILSVVPVPETNLLELRAEGEYPEQLQRAVNRWAESYEGFRAEEIEAATGRTTAELTDEQSQLQLKIEAARAELLGFREANDIVSLERDENRSLATLKGLNNSLNKAREALVEARARKMAIDEAIANGETVIPSEQKNDMTRMKLDVERTRARVADLKQKYTQRYIDRDPVLKNLPGMLNEMERELVRALELGERTVKDEAQQDVATAEASVTALERELIEHQDKVQKFTERFKEFKAMEEGLAGLEKLANENKARLAKIEVQNLKKYPPIQVVEWARVPSRPIYPDYERDLMIALAAALGLALFVTWLVEYLSERSRPSHATPYLGVRIYPDGQTQTIAAPQVHNQLNHDATVAAAPPAPANLPILPRELAGAELKSLMAVADPLTAGYAALLLSGISPYELPLLHSACFDSSGDRIEVPGASRREITIGQGAWRRLEPVLAEMAGSKMAVPLPELDQRLVGCAREAQLADPGSINALSLWHSYVLYLVRQGIDASALAARAGAIPPDVHGTMMHFAPPGGNRPLSSIEFIHPILVS
jgi:succinoglycan biosynthesis transport protein ExoP